MKHTDSKIQSIERKIDEEEEKFQKRWKEFEENLETGKAGPLEYKGQWHIEVGTALSPEEAFGPPSDDEIKANQRKPLRQIMAELYP